MQDFQLTIEEDGGMTFLYQFFAMEVLDKAKSSGEMSILTCFNEIFN